MSLSELTPGLVFPLDGTFMARIRSDMLGFARRELGNDVEVEDVVHDAITGGLRNLRSFRGEAAIRTWMIAILKYKLADLMRERKRRPVNASALADGECDGPLPSVFDRRGLWRDAARPARWENPEADLHSAQFMDVFDDCLCGLPDRQARIFMMREVIGLSPSDIAGELGLSPAHVSVILHRARLSLRACLQAKWLQLDETA